MLNRYLALKNCIRKVTVEKLCSRNLYAVDVTLKFLLNKLSPQNTVLSNAMKDSLIESKNYVSRDDYSIFNKNQSKTEIAKALQT
jgi:hypothetical protein